MQRNIFLLIILGLFSLVKAQDEPVIATRVVPLYCFVDVLDRPSAANVVVTKTENTLNKECVDRVRITFKNGDFSKIHNVTIDLMIKDETSSISNILYQARHIIPLQLIVNEVKTFDLILNNSISPPEGKKDFDEKKSWSWKIEIVKINSRTI